MQNGGDLHNNNNSSTISNNSMDEPPPPPPPRPSFLPPGFPPRGGALGGIGGSSGLLLKKAVSVEKELGVTLPKTGDLEAKNATAFMRELDTYRLHRPSATERELLNLPESMERLDLHDNKHFMCGCGFSRGARFSSQEIAQVQCHVHSLAETFQHIEARFNRLPPTGKKPALGTADQLVPEETEWKADLLELRRLGREYVDTYTRAMALLRAKQAEVRGRALDKEASPKQLQDEEDIAGSSLPEYLTVLLAKYHNESGSLPPKSGAAVDSVGKFASFLALCLFDEGQLTEHETAAMSVLIDASDDGSCSTCPLSPRSHAIHGRPQRYWAGRLHAFLSSLTELKSSSKGLNDLREFGHWPRSPLASSPPTDHHHHHRQKADDA